jgi:hypothetical protein
MTKKRSLIVDSATPAPLVGYAMRTKEGRDRIWIKLTKFDNQYLFIDSEIRNPMFVHLTSGEAATLRPLYAGDTVTIVL